MPTTIHPLLDSSTMPTLNISSTESNTISTTNISFTDSSTTSTANISLTDSSTTSTTNTYSNDSSTMPTTNISSTDSSTIPTIDISSTESNTESTISTYSGDSSTTPTINIDTIDSSIMIITDETYSTDFSTPTTTTMYADDSSPTTIRNINSTDFNGTTTIKISSTKSSIEEYCEAREYVHHNFIIKWPDTIHGKLATVFPCPKGSYGYATWLCSEVEKNFTGTPDVFCQEIDCSKPPKPMREFRTECAKSYMAERMRKCGDVDRHKVFERMKKNRHNWLGKPPREMKEDMDKMLGVFDRIIDEDSAMWRNMSKEDSCKTSMELIKETEATAWTLGCNDDQEVAMQKDNLGKTPISNQKKFSPSVKKTQKWQELKPKFWTSNGNRQQCIAGNLDVKQNKVCNKPVPRGILAGYKNIESYLSPNSSSMKITSGIIGFSDQDDLILKLLSLTCCCISSVALFLTVIVYLTVRSLRSRRNTITCNLAACLLAMNILIQTGLNRVEKTICQVVSAVLQYSVLSAFFWMLLEGILLYRMVITVFQTKNIRTFVLYIVAYGIPAFIVVFCSAMYPTEMIREKYCWPAKEKGLIWSVLGPVVLIIVVNLIIFGLTLNAAARINKMNFDNSSFESKKKTLVQRSKGMVSLTCLLGFTWAIGFFYVPMKVVTAYVFVVLNGLQGFFLFLTQIIFNDPVRQKLFAIYKENFTRFSSKTSSFML
ncbi:Adhesion G protein-coupled receptor L3 like protein [Argiope bruennichi]|uniref:Adhesion G protein-coupled receptor L3 like protein n=1 Tax=Argiope bruennichi TaxID=94029 RepID=A0A8T0EC29_ARGBR|nr:Adhesion G protein-coupled receptor L3 like protein [Argiope bruennichi]